MNKWAEYKSRIQEAEAVSTLNNDHVTSVPQGWVGGWMLYIEFIKSEAQTRHFSTLTGNTTIGTFVSDPIVSRKNKGNYYGQQSMVHIIREGVQMIFASTLQSPKENKANSSLCFGFSSGLAEQDRLMDR